MRRDRSVWLYCRRYRANGYVGEMYWNDVIYNCGVVDTMEHGTMPTKAWRRLCFRNHWRIKLPGSHR